MSYEAIVIGVSAGGLNALHTIIPELPKEYPLPVIVVQHRLPEADDFLTTYLDQESKIHVKQAEPRERIQQGVYIAPAGYHLLVERDRTFGFSVDPKVNNAIPSIDVLFETAADAYQNKLVGIVLTGANSDGSQGLKFIKKNGGLTIVQAPNTAESPFMPKAAIEAVEVDHIMPLVDIGAFLKTLPYTEKA